MFSFDHDAGELLRPGIAEDDAAIFAESRLGFGERSGDFGKSFEWRFGFYFDVDDDLRVVLEAFDQRFDFAVHGNERSDFYGGEKAVAGRTVFQKDDVAGLLAADDVAGAQHFLENVAIADRGAGECDSLTGEDALKTEIGHGCGDNAIALELILRFEVARNGKKNAVAVDDFSCFADEESAVGVAVECDTELGALGGHALLQTFKMKRAAAGVDVAAVRRHTHRDDIGSERAEKLGTEFIGGAIGAVQKDSKARQFSSREDAAAKKLEIFSVERFVGDKESRILGRRFGTVLENVRFEYFFDGIGKLHAGVREKLYAIVVVRIVRSGNDNAGLKIILADEAGDAGGGDDACKCDGCSRMGEAGGKQGGNVRSGFAGVHADEDVSSGMYANQIGRERTASSKESRVVERGSTGNTANAVGSEKVFRHEGLTFKS